MIGTRRVVLAIFTTLLLLCPLALAHRGHKKHTPRSKAATSDVDGRPRTGHATKADETTHRAEVPADSAGGSHHAPPHASPPAPKTVAAQAAPERSETPSGWLDIVGRLHPAVVHLPIGWLMLLVLVDLGAFALGKESWRKAGLLILIGTLASAIPAIASGLIRHSTHGPGDADTMILLHRNLMLIMVGVLVAALALRVWRRNQLQGQIKVAYLVALLLAAGLMVVAGHLGGKVVFGPDYLPF